MKKTGTEYAFYYYHEIDFLKNEKLCSVPVFLVPDVLLKTERTAGCW